jgi:phosphoribosylanthranilate isomerase
MPSVAGKPRFPTRGWIENFAQSAKGLHTAMHLCEQGLLDFIAGKKETLDLMQGFRRIQLNLKFGAVEGRYDPADLAARARSLPQHQFIVQYTQEKRAVLDLFKNVPNHAVLFDASAGRGISPDRWDAPLQGHFCGYAGGLNPDNVRGNIEAIEKVAPDYTTWIDMESGVRTDDVFDLAKVRRVLETVAPYAV